jgi:hypothetical protein
MAHISTASREEEAGSKALLVEISPSDSARDCRLPGAGQTIEPEDASIVLSVSPIVYISDEVDTGVGKAGRIVLSLVCIKGRVDGIR